MVALCLRDYNISHLNRLVTILASFDGMFTRLVDESSTYTHAATRSRPKSARMKGATVEVGLTSSAESGSPSSYGSSGPMVASRRARSTPAPSACGIWAINWTWRRRTPVVSASTMSTRGATEPRSCAISVFGALRSGIVRPFGLGLSRIAVASAARSRTRSRTGTRGVWHDQSTLPRTRSWSGWSAARGMISSKAF